MEHIGTSASQALSLQRMMDNQTSTTINANRFADHEADYRRRRTWRMLQLDPACFDAAYYAAENPDLPPWPEPRMFLHHWATSGQFEPRKFRYAAVWHVADVGHRDSSTGSRVLISLQWTIQETCTLRSVCGMQDIGVMP